jgi:hypothetical protein
MAGAMTAGDSIAAIEAGLSDPLADCRRRGGGVAFVGPDVPIEIMLASGRPFGHLPWRADGLTPWADRWLESSFPFWARSVLEQWHQDAFEALETVVFSRADDASQRLYYYVAELKLRGKLAGPAVAIFDIAFVPRESSLQHTQAAVLELMRSFDVNHEKLLEGIVGANRLRQKFAELERGRAANGSLYERLGRAALWTDPSRWIDDVEIASSTPVSARLLLAGSVPPDDRIHRAVDAAGASIIAEAHGAASVRFGAEIEPGDVPLERVLAEHMRVASIGPRAFFDRAAWIVDRATAVGATAVVIWLTREDEALAWSLPAIRQALDAARMPTLLLPAARWQCDDGALERIAEFCRECVSATA